MKKLETGGRLTPADRKAIVLAWNARSRNRGTVSALAKAYGVSHVAISNIILAKTGKRPNAHICPSRAAQN